MQLITWINGKKTYILGALVILGAWSSVALGQSDTQHAMDLTLAALGGMALRHGVEKSGPSQ